VKPSVSTDGHGRVGVAACSGLACAAESGAFPWPRARDPTSVPRGRPGKDASGNGRVSVRESVTVAGLAQRARVARAFPEGVLGPGHPFGDDTATEIAGRATEGSGPGWMLVEFSAGWLIRPGRPWMTLGLRGAGV
jgi:hypothetical protein